MGINKWRLIEPCGNEDPGSAQCMMCKEHCYEQNDMRFCPYCGTRWDGQMECSEKGRKWHDVVAKYGRSFYSRERYNQPHWSVQWRLADLVRGQWAKERCFNRRDAVVKYKDWIQRLEGSVHFWEVRIIRVMEDYFIKQVIISGHIGGVNGINQSNDVSEMLTKQ